MNEFTPAQNKAIETWTEQRDSLLKEISVLETEKAELTKKCKEEAESFTQMQLEESQIVGRIDVLVKSEEYHKNSVTKEVADLEARKSRLESECEAKERESKVFDKRKDEKLASIDVLSMVHSKMADQAKVVEEVVGQVIKNSELHVSNIVKTMADVDTLVTQVIEKSEKNVEQTNIVLEKLPKYIFELEKPIPLQRKFAPRKGNKNEDSKE